MAGMIFTTASVLNSVLSFIDSDKTPKIAFDNDEYALPLIEKMKESVGDREGSMEVSVYFSSDEAELERQFFGVCKNISSVFKGIADYYEF